MKTCKRCGIAKEENEFYARAAACKECAKDRERERYRASLRGEKLPPLPKPEGRRCNECGERKTTSEFARKLYKCKACQSAINKRYWWENRERNLEAKRRYVERNADKIKAARNSPEAKSVARQRRLAAFGMTVADWEKLYVAQGGRCAICRRPESEVAKGRLHVDHDHKCCPGCKGSCGKCVRGLLCYDCNSGIGRFRDDPAILRRALRYLGS